MNRTLAATASTASGRSHSRSRRQCTILPYLRDFVVASSNSHFVAFFSASTALILVDSQPQGKPLCTVTK
jgi:hypothetical protein